ncbi:Gfo/Idh/MocA family protein [Paenibacillus sp. GCM10023252]|uniref:Gfo/Idh/MocA family protein n=1 Tax=Paenibacillus sp. GCM10023252 TaxID=3252649 RepID=UPI00360647DE
MRVIQIGAGQFGRSWLTRIVPSCQELELVGVVDGNPLALEAVKQQAGLPEDILFTYLSEALQRLTPEIAINVTPPSVHREVSMQCMAAGVPVLCEKPIALNAEDAEELHRQSLASGIPVMIAENYRYAPIVRKLRGLIKEGAIGDIHAVHVQFFKHHPEFTNYHKDLPFPLLMDVAIHHLDMLRYLTGLEAVSVYARASTPPGSWYGTRYSDTELLLELGNKVKASYVGSLASFENTGSWLGDWRIEGERGMLLFDGQQITLSQKSGKSVYTLEDRTDNRVYVVQEFLDALRSGRPGETDISDNIRTYRMVEAAMESVRTHGVVHIRQ